MKQYSHPKRCTVCEYSLPPTYIRCCDANVCSQECANKRLFVIQIEDIHLNTPWFWSSKITDSEYKETKRIYNEELEKAEKKIKKDQEKFDKEKYDKETNNKCKKFLQQYKVLGGVSFSIFLIFIII